MFRLALYANPSQSYEASPAICNLWSVHVGLCATWHRWMRPVLTQVKQAGIRFTYRGEMKG